MKRWLLLIIILLLCGCNKKKEINCIYKDETNDKMKSYMRIILNYDDDLVLSEKLYAVYQFKNKEAATSNYSNLEKILEKDATVKLRQVDERIAAEGEKDVSDMQYDRQAKVAYYEKLGYTCN